MTALNFDIPAMTRFLSDLLAVPSPTGYHREVMPFTREAFAALNVPNLTITETPKGALLLHWPGHTAQMPVALTAHVDTLGFMVKEIKIDGRLKLTNLGGINWHGTEFENCTVRTFDDRRYRGTVILENPSTHVNREAHKTPRGPDTMELRLDVRADSRDEVEALGIAVGDFVFLDPRLEITDTGFIKARFLDDKASVACIYGALAALRDAGLQPAQDTYILIANYEEVGHGGAAGLPADLAELVAVDMAPIGPSQTSDEFSTTICAKDAGGPYHYETTSRLRHLAAEHDIAHNVDIYMYYASDGTAYWRSGGGARVGLCGPGVASSHGYERMHEDALHHSAHLLARYMLTPTT